MKRESIAAVAHAINAAYCAALGDASQPTWADAPDWQKASALAGVDMHLANPDATPEASHESWLAQKTAEGWKYGKVKDAAKKEHPCFMPYAKLPKDQKAKDYLFRAVVHALKDIPDANARIAAAEAVDDTGLINDIRAAARAEVEGELRASFDKAVLEKAQALAKEYVAKLPQAAAPTPAKGTIPIRYIGHRATYKEGAYGTGIVFTQGKSEFVPAKEAAQMLKHTDVYEPGDAAECGQTQQPAGPKKDDSDDPVQQQRDVIAVSSREALEAYARVHFNVALDSKQSVESLRTQVTGLLDQFGTE